MSITNKYKLKNILLAAIWITIGTGMVVLLVAAIERRNNERCSTIEIQITGVQNNFFIDKKDVISVLEKANGGKLEKVPLHSIDLARLETELRKNQWIKNAEIFFDNNNALQVRIKEREPIARIFTTSGSSFYIDSSLARLPLSDKFSPRLPVFTDFPTNAAAFSKEDSNLVCDIRTLSQFINDNPFWMAQIDQVDISSNRTFDLIPKLGDQVIHFGNAENYEQKFRNLLCFYKQVLTKLGWAHYSAIDVQYKGQVIGIRRGATEIKMDSLRSVQIMKALIAEAQRNTNDSANIQLDQPDDNNEINTSKENETIPDEDSKTIINNDDKNVARLKPVRVAGKPATNHQISIKGNAKETHSSPIEKSRIDKPTANSKDVRKTKRVPKAVMPSKTDY